MYEKPEIGELCGGHVNFTLYGVKGFPGSYYTWAYPSSNKWNDLYTRTILLAINYTTWIVPFSACGTKSQNPHYYAKSQNWWGLEFLPSDTKSMNTCSFTMKFKKSSVCYKVLLKFEAATMRIVLSGAIITTTSTLQNGIVALRKNHRAREPNERLAMRHFGLPKP